MLVKINKIVLLFSFLFSLTFFSLISINKVSAGNEDILFKPQLSIPNSDFKQGINTTIEDSTATIGKYVRSIYNYLLAIVGLVAAIVLMLGGVIWLTAAGNTDKISQAKSLVMGSLTGIVLILTSYIILRTINPSLVDLEITPIEVVDQINTGCCIAAKNKPIENVGPNSCYLKITEGTSSTSVETNIEKLKETLKSNYDNNLEKYLKAKGLYFPNSMADFTNGSCTEKNYCLYCYEDTFVNGSMETKKNCEDLKGISIKNEKDKNTIPQSELNKLLGQSTACDNSINNYYSKKDIQEIIETIDSKNSKTCQGQEDGWKVGSSDNYCYKGRIFKGDGKKNEPCGNDGGICVPSDKDCNKYSSTGKRDYGGRDCDSRLKCCSGI